MAFKLVVLVAFVAVAGASYAPVGPLAYAAAPVAKTVVDTEYDPNPQYTYSYGVQDALTGDAKSQTETRSGDVVKGQYSLIDSDGTKRTVDYAADPINGFNAVVSKTPLAIPVVAKVAAPVAYAAPAVAAPVLAKVAAPVAYSGPAVAYNAPAYSAPAYSAPAFAYSAPAVASPLAYTAPAVAKFAAPLAYAAPGLASYSAGPVTKTIVQGPSAVSYTSPAVSYTAAAAPLAYAAPAAYSAPLAYAGYKQW